MDVASADFPGAHVKIKVNSFSTIISVNKLESE